MRNTVLPRKPVALPSLDSLDPNLSLEMARISARLDALATLPPKLVREAPDPFFAPLKHRLSCPFVEVNGPPGTAIRSEDEFEALEWLEGGLAPLDGADPASFPQLLKDLNLRITGGSGGWRRGEIGTAHDVRGNSIRFPPPSCIPAQLERLRRLLSESERGRPALLTAIITLVLITNCHPFRDGNGRVGRVLFNHVLRRRGGMGHDVYIPLYELADRSEGGYLIALRQGELRGEWTSLLEFVMKLLEVHSGLVEWERRNFNG